MKELQKNKPAKVNILDDTSFEFEQSTGLENYLERSVKKAVNNAGGILSGEGFI
ncbi:conserved hypothetical protein [Xenorhabdus bovienii str. Intermedium]|uniref:Uncharacterized protein n=1 Tax=Xenorhabdus bovienii str. Intermedium TaxID=1379677 RepID=A0A077QCS6_XENBV|nr:conserved hypothetical protein [Xenorhabdus bovienii str. Intermedium]